MQYNRYLICAIILSLSLATRAQESNYRVLCKTLADGTIQSRVVTFDSMDVMELKQGKIMYELLSGNTVVHSRELARKDTNQLRAIYEARPEYYLGEMLSIYLDPDQQVTIDEVYPYLIFLSYFTMDGAMWLGLATEDKVNPDRAYSVRYTLISPTGKKIVLGNAEVKNNGWPTVYGSPDSPELKCSDLDVEVRLDAENLGGVYFGFNAQKRRQGSTEWEYISKSITINPYYESKYGKYRYSYMLTDSLVENNVVYEYRMVGRDFFGEYGTPGKSNSCYGWQPLASYATHYAFYMADDSTARFQWQIADTVLPKIKSIDLLISKDSMYGNYFGYMIDLNVHQREFIAKIPDPVGYFKYRTIPHFGDTIYSFPFFIQRWDNIAPANPKNLKGNIDSSGIVTLEWTPNHEKDFWGYRVFYANNKTDEFSLLTSQIIGTNKWHDTINLNNLSPEMYYKIVALDWRGNISGFSDILTIVKPDTLAPSPALIRKIRQYKNSPAVLLLAIGSSSRDVKNHILFRKRLDEVHFRPIDTIGLIPKDTVLYDNQTEFDKSYEYFILATDKSGNKTWSDTIGIEVMMKGLLPGLNKIEAVIDTSANTVLFTWENQNVLDMEVEIYRTNEEGQFTLYKVLPAVAGTFTDSLSRSKKTLDQYKARLLYADGSYSKLKEVQVQIKNY